MSTMVEDSNKKTSKQCTVGASSPIGEFDRIILLVSLLALYKAEKHCWGPTEEEWRAACGVKKDSFDHALSGLLYDKLVTHNFCQEGTAGPFAHRFTVKPKLTITVDWPIER